MYLTFLSLEDYIGDIMVSMLSLSALVQGFELQSDPTEHYQFGIWCFYAKHAALRSKSKDLFAWNQDNVFELSDMSTRRLLFQWDSTIKIKLRMLVLYKAEFSRQHHHLIKCKHCSIGVKQRSLTHSLTRVLH